MDGLPAAPLAPSPIGPWRIGIDVGGTFTDLVLLDAAGAVFACKSPSNSSDPAAGVIATLDLAAERVGVTTDRLLAECGLLVHGSTIATNTLLELKGAKVGLLVTDGLRDSLEIRRGLRSDVWDHRAPYPPVLVPRQLRRPIGGRLDVEGSELAPLDEDAVREAALMLRAEGVESVAICFLHSYRNPAHEDRARSIVHGVWPDVPISCSHEIAPVVGEYERSSTVVVNAFVAPRVVPYLRKLDAALRARGLKRDMLLVQSNGGAVSVTELGDQAVQLILSGPAAGVGAIHYFGHDTGTSKLVAIEVGGTSCDVTLSADGHVAMTDQLEVDGYHLMMPAVEIHTVGAGGGTIARVDGAGFLHAGPQGAGARPGPACYGFGGEKPTVTDAQLLLGRLKPGPYAGGAITLDPEKARAAIVEHLAKPLGISPEAAAAGMLRLVEQTMQHAVERVSAERGHNPRAFTLIAAGGAGPLHGVGVARALGCPAVYIPRLAGVFCAFGMCHVDIRRDYLHAWLRDLDMTGPSAALEDAFSGLEARAVPVLQREGFGPRERTMLRSMDMRYFGQQGSVAIGVAELEPSALRKRFEDQHEHLYGYHQPDGEIELINLRVAAIGHTPPLGIRAPASEGGAPEPHERRDVWLDRAGGLVEVPVYDGAALLPGHRLEGPGLIEEATTTILVDASSRLEVTAAGNYLIHLN